MPKTHITDACLCRKCFTVFVLPPEGYSGDNCTTEASACDSFNCPAGSECIEEDSTATCRCGANQLMSGGSCKGNNHF